MTTNNNHNVENGEANEEEEDASEDTRDEAVTETVAGDTT